MTWFTTTLQWYAYLLVLGIIFTPLTEKLFGNFFEDHGFPFSKTLAVIFLTYSMFVLGVFKLVTFAHMNVLLVVGLWMLINFCLRPKQTKHTHSLSIPLVIFEEALFLVCLLAWVYVRGQEPSIRGLEKFMDFGFINSALRSTYFPPLDMWLSGFTINYYYFGHLTGAVITRLTQIPAASAYNLILATIFASGVTHTFSLCHGLIKRLYEHSKIRAFVGALIGAFIVNLAGNLHTIYMFTTGYQGEKPTPFWQLPAKFSLSQLLNIPYVWSKLSDFYWYPNATRFIPFTIHEFPLYSYVVADLHGHVFDIPFVLLTLAVLFTLFLQKHISTHIDTYRHISTTIFLGFLASVHYMTNAFDGPIYLLLTTIIFFILFKFTTRFAINVAVLVISFIIFSLPFSAHFQPFVSGIGVNCAPQFLVSMGKLGPFLFERGNCQTSAPWMLMILWGFFWFNFIAFVLATKRKLTKPDSFILALFGLGTFLILIPEFFYIKDIYPAHFRANTMFKLGYQAFMMMGIASTYALFYIKRLVSKKNLFACIYLGLFIPLFLLIAAYPERAIRSYYGELRKTPQTDGIQWLMTDFPGYKEVIDFLNQTVPGQPTILEAQGDSYTDFNVVSAYTGLPTIAGWWVHEWLWRGDSNVVGKLIPDIQTIYEGTDEQLVDELVRKHNVEYIIIGPHERKKYQNLNEEVLRNLYKVVFISSDQTAQIFATKRP